MRKLAGALLLTIASLTGCNSATINAIGGLSFSASATPLAPSTGAVRTDVVVMNATRDPFDITYTCPVRTVYRSGNANGTIVYDSRVQSCSSGATTTQIGPGESVTLSGVSTPGLPSGTYFLTALLTVNGETTAVDAGTVTL